jgi:hypothetical protein
MAFWRDLLELCRGRIVFFHNWAGYDVFHSLNALMCLATELNLNVIPLLHNGKIIELKVIQNNKVILTIKDSILFLPMGLGKLAQSFKVPTLKEHSPHYFNPAEHGYPNYIYIGAVPAYEFF